MDVHRIKEFKCAAHNEAVKIADIGFDCGCVRFYVCVCVVFYGTEGHSVQYGNQKQHSGVCFRSSALSVIPPGKWHVCKPDN